MMVFRLVVMLLWLWCVLFKGFLIILLIRFSFLICGVFMFIVFVVSGVFFVFFYKIDV